VIFKLAKKRYIEDGEISGIRGMGKKKKAVLLIFIIGATTAAVLVGFSFKSINFNEFALRQNIITKEISTEIYGVGFYYTGLFETFIYFPSTWQTVEFSPAEDANDIPISTRTKDGLAVTADISFQYRINSSNLLTLYSEFGIDYEDFISKVARGVLRDVTSDYDAGDFFFNRTIVTQAMSDALVAKEAVLYVEIGEFQLRQIDLPDDYEKKIEDAEVAKLDQTVAQFELEAAEIRARIDIVNAYASANATIINAAAAAQALNLTITAEGIALFNLANQTGFNTTELLYYLYIQAIEEHESSYLIIGENTPILFQL
jgi:regulator of protease activity HflC (stomatin/prohibitin superfamily)